MHPSSSSCHATVALALLLVLAAAAQPTITDLGVLPTGTYLNPRALSADGSTVVGYGNSASGGRAFRWRASTGAVSLGLPAGTNESHATAVNGNGDAVTGYASGITFRWTQTSGFQSVGTLPSHYTSDPGGMSDDGTIVVGRSMSSSVLAGFKWNAGVISPLSPLADATGCVAYGVSGDGTIPVGMATRPANTSACRWSAAGTPMDLGILAGGTYSRAESASSDGAVVVGVSGSSGGDRAFRWTVAAGMQNLGVPTNGTSSTALAISADGSTVVGSSEVDGEQAATVWQERIGQRELAPLLASLGTDLEDMRLTEAVGASVDGSTLLVRGYRGNPSLPRALLVRGFPPGYCAADVGSQGGEPGRDNVLDNNDFIIFISQFFLQVPSADRGRAGGVAGSDGLFDNNDFIVFISQFFEGCP